MTHHSAWCRTMCSIQHLYCYNSRRQTESNTHLHTHTLLWYLTSELHLNIYVFVLGQWNPEIYFPSNTDLILSFALFNPPLKPQIKFIVFFFWLLRLQIFFFYWLVLSLPSRFHADGRRVSRRLNLECVTRRWKRQTGRSRVRCVFLVICPA